METKLITVFLAPLVVVLLSGTGHAQLFIEDFDTFSAWSGGDGTQITSKTGDTTNGWVKGSLHNLRRLTIIKPLSANSTSEFGSGTEEIAVG